MTDPMQVFDPSTSCMDGVDSWEGAGKFFRSFSTNAVAMLSIGLNSLSLMVLSRSTVCFEETTKLIITAMSVMDLCTGLQILLLENLSTWSSLPDVWDGYCKLAYPSMAFIQLCSTMFVVVLSVDRLVMVTRPLKYRTIVTKSRLKLILSTCVIPPTIVAYAVRQSYFSGRTRYCRMYLVPSEYPLMLLVALMMFIAIVITTFVNINLLRIATRMKKKISPMQENTKSTISAISLHISGLQVRTVERPKDPARDMKALRTVLIITTALYIGWFPFFFRVVHNFITLEKSGRIFEFIGFFAGYNCSWFNPVVYLLMNSAFRREAVSILKRQVS